MMRPLVGAQRIVLFAAVLSSACNRQFSRLERPPQAAATGCDAGSERGCTCATGGTSGTQVCSADGTGYGACDCTQISIFPDNYDLSAGASVALHPTVTGNDGAPEFAATCGSVDVTSGVYVAPDTPGTCYVDIGVSGSLRTLRVTLRVHPKPTTPVIVAPSALVSNEKNVQAQVAAPVADLAYEWSLTGGVLQSAPAATGVTFDVSITSGNIILSVAASNAAGDRSLPAVAVIPVGQPLGAADVPIIGLPPKVTQGRALAGARVLNANVGLSYVWRAAGDATLTGASGPKATFSVSAQASSVTLCAYAENSVGFPSPETCATAQAVAPGLERLAGPNGGSGTADGQGSDARLRPGMTLSGASGASALYFLNFDMTSGASATPLPPYALRTLDQSGVVNTLLSDIGPTGPTGPTAPMLARIGDDAYWVDPTAASGAVHHVSSSGSTDLVTDTLGATVALNGPPIRAIIAGLVSSVPTLYYSTNSAIYAIAFNGTGHALSHGLVAGSGSTEGCSESATPLLGRSKRLVLDDSGQLYSHALQNGDLGPYDGLRAINFPPIPSTSAPTIYGYKCSPSGTLINFPGFCGATMPFLLSFVGGSLFAACGNLDAHGGPTAGAHTISRYDGFPGTITATQIVTHVVPGYADGSGATARFSEFDDVGGLGSLLMVGDQANVALRAIGNLGATGPSSSTVTTLAGGPALSGFQDSPIASAARFDLAPSATSGNPNPIGVLADDLGNIYVTDENNQRIRLIDGQSGAVSTAFGDGNKSYAAGSAKVAEFKNPTALAWLPNGALLIADAGNRLLRWVDPTGLVLPWAGVPGSLPPAVDGTRVTAVFADPLGVAVDLPTKRVFVSDAKSVRLILPTDDVLTIAGNGGCSVAGIIPNPIGVHAQLCYLADIALGSGAAYALSGQSIDVLRQIVRVATDGDFAVSIACAATLAALGNPLLSALAAGPSGELYLAYHDLQNAKVARIDPTSCDSTNSATVLVGSNGRVGVHTGPLPSASVALIGGLSVTPVGDILMNDTVENAVLLLRP